MQISSRVSVPTSAVALLPERRHLLHAILVVTIAFLSLYISAAIFLDVPLGALINVIGLVAALVLWKIPHRAWRIADVVLLGAIMILQCAIGFDLLAFCLLGIVGVIALMRMTPAWLYVGTGLVVLIAGNGGATMSRNGGLVPRLFTDAVPGLDFHLPPMLASLVMVGISLGLLAVGTWKFALRIDIFAVALFVTAFASLVGGILSFSAMSVPALLAELFPGTYSFEEESLEMTSYMLSTARMSGKGILMAGVIPLIFSITAGVRLFRQPSFALRGAPLLPTSYGVAMLTAIALVVPGSMILLLALVDSNNPLQLVLPFVIDGSSLVLWIIAVIAWWRHTDVVRAQYAPGGDLTSTDCAVTLILAAAPALLAMFDLGLAIVP